MPTREGASVLALTVFLFLLATNLMAGWLFLLVAFQAGVLLVGLFTAFGAVQGVRVELAPAAVAIEGGEVVIPMAASSRRPARFVRVEVNLGAGRAAAFFPALAQTQVEAAVRVSAPRRGVHQIERVLVTSRGLLGMARARRAVNAASRVVVRPSYRSFREAGRLISGEGGMTRGKRARHGELAGVREYVAGDPIRHLHWRSSARRGRLVVKEFESPAGMEVYVLADTDARHTEDALDAVARAAASVLRGAMDRRYDAVLMACSSDRIATVRGSWESLWDALARLRPEGPPLEQALTRARTMVPAGAVLLAVTSSPLRSVPEVVQLGPAGSAAEWWFESDGEIKCAS